MTTASSVTDFAAIVFLLGDEAPPKEDPEVLTSGILMCMWLSEQTSVDVSFRLALPLPVEP